MDERNRQELNEIWQNNEKRIEAAQNLKAGAESPVDRLEDLERQQDEIEHEMGLDYLAQRASEKAPDAGGQNP